ncbi:MAG: uroporphyrinogen-III synthase [Paludibacteraceae bacterium]|nr:uroporphyrinogen-III synthase [Paludibacteraceae bacterium]MBO7338176.1 uroporphyrinogen-III synthase [Paludibacteraceae bacterium]MBP5136867.1 uroporphyrinogen-III synthase [Paludibacteraceae bacterium]MBP5741863.1 uroporphyrinogen-III synthase [Paludibacteraceae bacterium]
MKIKKILVSQPKPESEKSPYYDIEKKYGVNIVFRQFFKNEPVDVKDFRKQRIDILAHTAIIFTAKLGIDNFFRLCKELRVTVPDDMKYFCTSEKISLYLQHYIQYRKRKIFFGADSKFESLISVMEKHKDEKFLLVGADSQNEEQKAQESGRFKALEEKGFTFDKAVMYRTVNNYFQPDETFDYDMIVFFSPNGIVSLLENFPDFEQGDISIACLGEKTAAAIKNTGRLRLDVEVPSPQFSSITAALDSYVKENHKKK